MEIEELDIKLTVKEEQAFWQIIKHQEETGLPYCEQGSANDRSITRGRNKLPSILNPVKGLCKKGFVVARTVRISDWFTPGHDWGEIPDTYWEAKVTQLGEAWAQGRV